MRILANIVLVAATLALVSCKHHEVSILPDIESVSQLNITANTSSNQVDRARAIFTLFAYHLRPGCSAADVRSVLTDTQWLQPADVSRLDLLAGWIPVNPSDDSTIYDLHLFSTEKDRGTSEWGIEFCLSGKHRGRTDGLAFLKGDTTLKDNPKMVEFALIFPAPPLKESHISYPGMRIEDFSEHGIHVYGTNW